MCTAQLAPVAPKLCVSPILASFTVRSPAATGVGQVVEVYDQLTGAAGERTVNDAKIGLTHNFGATGASCAVHIFQSV